MENCEYNYIELSDFEGIFEKGSKVDYDVITTIHHKYYEEVMDSLENNECYEYVGANAEGVMFYKHKESPQYIGFCVLDRRFIDYDYDIYYIVEFVNYDDDVDDEDFEEEVFAFFPMPDLDALKWDYNEILWIEEGEEYTALTEEHEKDIEKFEKFFEENKDNAEALKEERNEIIEIINEILDFIDNMEYLSEDILDRTVEKSLRKLELKYRKRIEELTGEKIEEDDDEEW